MKPCSAPSCHRHPVRSPTGRGGRRTYGQEETLPLARWRPWTVPSPLCLLPKSYSGVSSGGRDMRVDQYTAWQVFGRTPRCGKYSINTVLLTQLVTIILHAVLPTSLSVLHYSPKSFTDMILLNPLQSPEERVQLML